MVPRSKRAPLSEVKNCLDQLINLFSQPSIPKDLALRHAGVNPPLILHNSVDGHMAMDKWESEGKNKACHSGVVEGEIETTCL